MTAMAKSKSKSPAQEALWENVRTIVYALILAMGIRFAIAQPFRIPSGSMQPTMLVGDYIVVTKWSYGYSRFSIAPFEWLGPSGRLFASRPERGDIVVFRPPGAEDKDFVKRLIGMPGDRIQMIDGVLYINNEPIRREYVGETDFTDLDELGDLRRRDIPTYRETLPNGVSYTTFDELAMGPFDTTPMFTIPENHYFMMGDNRDNSEDSRAPGGVVGYVPFDNLVGKAQFVAVSFDHTTKLWQPWTLITGLRGDRFIKGVNS